LSAGPLISRSGAELRYSSYDVLVIGGGIAGLPPLSAPQPAACGPNHRAT
jgi:hypothetical protein